MKRVALVLLLVSGCGSDPYRQGSEAPPPQGPQSPLDQLVAAECGRCHNGKAQPRLIRTEAELKAADAAGAKRRIETAAMPPDRRLAADVKARLLSVY